MKRPLIERPNYVQYKSPSFRKDFIEPPTSEETVCIGPIYKTAFDQIEELGEAMQKLGMQGVIDRHGAVGGAIELLKGKVDAGT